MRVCLYEDRRAADFGPLTLTRPVSDLLCGVSSLGQKLARYLGVERVGYLCRPVLADLLQSRDPLTPVNGPVWLRSAPTLLVNARWLPLAQRDDDVPDLSRLPVLGMCAGEVAFAALDPRQLQAVSPTTLDDCLNDWAQSLPTCEAGGRMLRHPWDLIEHNPEEIARDFEAIRPPFGSRSHLHGFALVGPANRLHIHPSAQIDPMVVADTTGGPVWIGPGAVVTAFTRLEGPCVIGPGTHLFGAKIRAGTTLGPVCRIGGEIECSIVQGFTNKYHDGFLGHSYVGEWVNLAAGTITGDLRFDYDQVSMRVNGATIRTGQTKLGSVIGDHARTGLGVLFDCGTTVGPFASVLPTGTLAPRDVPAFTRIGPDAQTTSPTVDQLLETAGVVMQRRGRELTPTLEAVYRAIAGQTVANAKSVTVPPAPMRKSA